MEKMEKIPTTNEGDEVNGDEVEKVVDANKTTEVPNTLGVPTDSTENPADAVTDTVSPTEAEKQSTDVVNNTESQKQINMLKTVISIFENDRDNRYASKKEEYKELTSKIMKTYEKKLNYILNNKENDGQHLDISSLMADENKAKEMADAYMEPQPEEITEISKNIKNVLENGNVEQKKALNDTIEEMQNEINKFCEELKIGQ